jgi:GAF domain-containing protein
VELTAFLQFDGAYRDSLLCYAAPVLNEAKLFGITHNWGIHPRPLDILLRLIVLQSSLPLGDPHSLNAVVAVVIELSNIEKTIITGELSRRPEGPMRLAEEVGALQEMARCFDRDSEQILQRVVEIAIDLCQAHSAGISLEHTKDDGAASFCWVAAAGQISRFRGRTISRDQSLGGVALDRGMSLLFYRPGVVFTELDDSECPIIEALLVPLQVDSEDVGTIWALSHTEDKKFDREDLRLLQSLANMAVLAVRSRRMEKTLTETAAALGAAQAANRLAHQINNPLQALQNNLYLALHDHPSREVLSASQQADRVCELVKYILHHDASDANLKLLQFRCKKAAVSAGSSYSGPVYCKRD